MTEIPKAYEPQSVEDKWYDFWLKHGCFTAEPARVSDKRPAYSIVIPPPNVTGMLHMGHVLNNTIQDILARKARMDGKEVLWLPGTDHAGIATQVQVERALKKEERLTKHDLGREKFLERVWQWKEKHGGIIIQQLKKLGCSCDWTRERFTMDPEYSCCVQKVFVELYKKGLIYRGKRMVNWCPATQTALSDEEVEMKPQKGFMYHFKVEVAEVLGQASRLSHSSKEKDGDRRDACPTGDDIRLTDTWLTIATTRPETIPGDTAVAVNPKDTRYAHLIGKHIVRPLPPELPREQKLIPIIGDEHVDFEFGTGVLKVTPAHDKADFDIGQRHKLPIVDIMNPDATMNTLAGGPMVGLDRFKARKVAVELLREQGALVEEKPYENNVGFSQRADVPIEPRLSEQWFLKYPAVEQSKACVEQEERSAEHRLGANPADETGRDGARRSKLHFHPQRWVKVYDHWLTNIQDWCISRQLWWGHRIPVWYRKTDAHALRKEVRVVSLDANLIAGKNIREIRASAWKWAESHGILGHTFQNQDTGFEILVAKSSLEHAFSNLGVVNLKLVSGLPELMREAILIATEPHEPFSPEVKCVHVFYAALNTKRGLYRVKFTVKEFGDHRKLYDHQSLQITKNGPDGNKSPEAHPEGKLAHWPASGPAVVKLADLIVDVNTDKASARCQIESPGDDWEQDPDVLDTWFSSWLWPFATMGWVGDKSQDSKNPTLRAFYPTTDLVTGPDIIFFWVARMIMAGYEFMGNLPFRNVYFTGIIRDKQGRKMSKTLGNSPDPLELIAKYGADALRFGTMRSAPLGQDVLFDEKDVELGRNFCNKLWNACRFRQLVGQASRLSPSDSGNTSESETGATPVLRDEVQGEIYPKLLTTDDKWILLKLDQAIRDITTALAEYKFSEATAALYRFFWSEYCDWYVEASKAVLSGSRRGNEAQTEKAESGKRESENKESQSLLTSAATNEEERRANTVAVIDFVLSHTLRLFHPFLPFITEELWHGMGYAEDMPENQGGKTIMNAPWPKSFDEDFKGHYGLDDCYLEMVNAKYDLVTQGRNLRREGNIPSNKKVKFVFKPAGTLSQHDAEVLKILLNAEALEVNAEYQPKKGTPTVRADMGELFLPLEGLIDVAAEKARLTKEIANYEAEIVKVEQKLNNPAFVQKVPPAVLAEHQKRLADWQAKLEHAKKAFEALG